MTDLQAPELGSRTEALVRSPGTVWRRVGSGVVILSRAGAYPVCLDEAGEVVWDALEEATTIDAIVSALADRYQTDPVQIRSGVESVLGALDEAGAVRGGGVADR